MLSYGRLRGGCDWECFKAISRVTKFIMMILISIVAIIIIVAACRIGGAEGFGSTKIGTASAGEKTTGLAAPIKLKKK